MTVTMIAESEAFSPPICVEEYVGATAPGRPKKRSVRFSEGMRVKSTFVFVLEAALYDEKPTRHLAGDRAKNTTV